MEKLPAYAYKVLSIILGGILLTLMVDPVQLWSVLVRPLFSLKNIHYPVAYILIMGAILCHISFLKMYWFTRFAEHVKIVGSIFVSFLICTLPLIVVEVFNKWIDSYHVTPGRIYYFLMLLFPFVFVFYLLFIYLMDKETGKE